MSRFALALTVAACWISPEVPAANIFLYNAADDQQAQAAKKSYSEVELKKSLEAERKALAAMTVREQAAVERDQRALRDAELIDLLRKTEQGKWSNDLQTKVNERLKTLTGNTNPIPKAKGVSLVQALDTYALGVANAETDYGAARHTYFLATGGRVLPDCPIKADGDAAPKNPRESSSFQSLKALCDLLLEQRNGSLELIRPDSLLGKTDSRLASIAGEIAAAQADLKNVKSELKDALAKAGISRDAGKADASKAPEVEAPRDPGDLAKAAESLQAKLANLHLEKFVKAPSSLDPVLSKLKLEALQEKALAQKDVIEAFLKSIEGKAPADNSDALKLIAAASGLVNAATQSPDTQATALVLQAELLRVQAQSYERQIARANERIALLKKQRAALIDEIVTLAEAQRNLDTYRTMKIPATAKRAAATACPRDDALFTDYGAATLDCKVALAGVLGGWSNSWTLGRAEYEKLEYLLLAQSYDAALDDSESAVAKVDTLIRIPLEQVSKAYASGIRPEDLSNLIHALGLSVIGARVK